MNAKQKYYMIFYEFEEFVVEKSKSQFIGGRSQFCLQLKNLLESNDPIQ